MFNMPSITPAQIMAAVGQVVAVAVAFGANLSPDQQKTLLALSVTIGAVLLWIDKEIRAYRAANAVQIAQAKIIAEGKAAPSNFFAVGNTITDTGMSPGIWSALKTKPSAKKKPLAKKKPARK